MAGIPGGCIAIKPEPSNKSLKRVVAKNAAPLARRYVERMITGENMDRDELIKWKYFTFFTMLEKKKGHMSPVTSQ